MTRQVGIVVEGQTEEAFISQVLAPHLGSTAWLTPIIVRTKRTASGAHRGGGTWKGYQEKLRRLSAERHWDMVTTMIDFYGYPADAPGAKCHPQRQHKAADCATLREQAIRDQVSAHLSPFVMVHEFETLVLAAASRQTAVWGDARAPERCKAQDGIDIIAGGGLIEVLEMCPRFGAWVRSLSDRSMSGGAAS